MAGKDYAKLARERISRPSETKRKPKYLIYARNKKGKTTFALSMGVDKTLVLDPEKGTDEMKKLDPQRWPIEKWEDIDDAYQFLRNESHTFEWVAVDGLTKMSNMALKYVMRLEEEKSLTRIPGLVQQRDYGKAGELMKEMLNRFHSLEMGVIFTAQERMEDANDSEEDEDAEEAGSMFVADLPKGVRGTINSIVDVIGRLYVVKVDDAEGNPKTERRLWIGESNKYDTGYRSDFELPNYIRQPSIAKLVRLTRTGTTKAPVRKAS